MTWGPYYFFYECPKCGKKYRWLLDDMNEEAFSNCPDCHKPGRLTGETRDIEQGGDQFADYEYI